MIFKTDTTVTKNILIKIKIILRARINTLFYHFFVYISHKSNFIELYF